MSAFKVLLRFLYDGRLAELRQERGLTQEKVAEAAGISRNHYQLLEYGLGKRDGRKPANPRLSTLVALSEVLGTTVPELINTMFPPNAQHQRAGH